MTALRIRTAAIILLSSLSIVKTEIVDKRPFKYGQAPRVRDVSVHKVTLTQKGYIQFLRYIADAPVITEFTFCIWIKSVNYTYSHPLLSYSRFDTERLIRGWISPGGETLNLAILEKKIFSVPVDLIENQWYHICQSWSSYTGKWMAFLDGQVISAGTNQEIRTVTIPRGGEIVVGQEYTDFDKGLDDGIEGDIYGFNLVLASASSPIPFLDGHEPIFLQENSSVQKRQSPSRHSMNIYKSSPQFNNYGYDPKYQLKLTRSRTYPQIATHTDASAVLRYFDTDVQRDPKRMYIFEKDALNTRNLMRVEKPVQLKSVSALSDINRNEKLNYGIYYAPRHVHYAQGAYNSPSQQLYPVRRILNVNDGSAAYAPSAKPLGLLLVELGYNSCALGKGAPINDKRLLISWTKTPVRVFGGAILKNIVPFCLQQSRRAR